MKSKKLLFIVFFLMKNNFLFPQCISIELSVTWKMGYDLFKKDSVMSIPYLNITYRNSCNTNYYFKVSSRKNVGMTALLYHANHIGVHVDTQAIAKAACGKGVGKNFNVIMQKSTWYGNDSWKAFNDTIDFYTYESAYESCFDINSSLNAIYEYFYPPIDYDEIKKPLYFVPSDITPENISGSVIKNNFVFLQPEETHIDTYNLIGFKLVEGCFTFLFDQNTIEDYVEGPGIGGYGTLKIPLPPVVGEYHLYSGSFNTNKVTVCFGEK